MFIAFAGISDLNFVFKINDLFHSGHDFQFVLKRTEDFSGVGRQGYQAGSNRVSLGIDPTTERSDLLVLSLLDRFR